MLCICRVYIVINTIVNLCPLRLILKSHWPLRLRQATQGGTGISQIPENICTDFSWDPFCLFCCGFSTYSYTPQWFKCDWPPKMGMSGFPALVSGELLKKMNSYIIAPPFFDTLSWHRFLGHKHGKSLKESKGSLAMISLYSILQLWCIR